MRDWDARWECCSDDTASLNGAGSPLLSEGDGTDSENGNNLDDLKGSTENVNDFDDSASDQSPEQDLKTELTQLPELDLQTRLTHFIVNARLQGVI